MVVSEASSDPVHALGGFAQGMYTQPRSEVKMLQQFVLIVVSIVMVHAKHGMLYTGPGWGRPVPAGPDRARPGPWYLFDRRSDASVYT